MLAVLEENWEIVEVFRLCQPAWIVTFGGAAYQGVSAIEVHTASQMLGIEPSSYRSIIEGVRIMSDATVLALRERTA